MPDRRTNIPCVQRDVVQSRIEGKRESWLCVIAIEGEKTEEQYFRKFGSKKVKVDTLPTLSGDSSEPESVIERLRKYKSENDVGEDDECWLVVDVDDRSEERLKKVCVEAKEEHFQIAISNPCFEFWFFLHRFEAGELPQRIYQVAVDKRPNEMKQILNQMMANNRYHSLPYGEFLIEVDKAIQRAKNQRKTTRSIVPRFPGTDVYKVVVSLREKAPKS